MVSLTPTPWTPAGWGLLREGSVPPSGQGDNPRPRTDIDAGQAEDRWLLCVACDARVTSESARIEIEGAHIHHRVNPSAEAYRIGCFCHAPGVLPVGPSSTFWTWFPPFSWQSVVCAGCDAHLGWHFVEGQREFHGLILDRLRVGPGRSLS